VRAEGCILSRNPRQRSILRRGVVKKRRKKRAIRALFAHAGERKSYYARNSSLVIFHWLLPRERDQRRSRAKRCSKRARRSPALRRNDRRPSSVKRRYSRPGDRAGSIEARVRKPLGKRPEAQLDYAPSDEGLIGRSGCPSSKTFRSAEGLLPTIAPMAMGCAAGTITFANPPWTVVPLPLPPSLSLSLSLSLSFYLRAMLPPHRFSTALRDQRTGRAPAALPLFHPPPHPSLFLRREWTSASRARNVSLSQNGKLRKRDCRERTHDAHRSAAFVRRSRPFVSEKRD